MRTLAFATTLLASTVAIADDASTVSTTASEPTDLATSSAQPRQNPRLALELSGGGSYVASPYVQYQGWTLENGPGMGLRLEANLVGIVLGFEQTSFANDRACGAYCVTGDFGTTRVRALDLGFRYRFMQRGRVKPFLGASIGGVLARTGNWNMSSRVDQRGGQARAGFGIEVPFAGSMFASVGVFYRVLVTENPLRNPDQQDTTKLFMGTDPTTADYAEDMHLVTVQIGIGAAL